MPVGIRITINLTKTVKTLFGILIIDCGKIIEFLKH